MPLFDIDILLNIHTYIRRLLIPKINTCYGYNCVVFVNYVEK